MGIETALALGGSALLGGLISGHAASSAADTQASAANHATDIQQQNLQQTQQNLQPYMQGGLGAQRSLSNMLGIGDATDAGTYGSLTKPFDAAEFAKYQDPGYQFQLQQGQQALQNSQASKDGVLSGAAMKGMIGFNQGMAQNAYQGAYSRYMSQNDATYSRLKDLLGIGENAAAGFGNTSANATQSIGNTIMGGANAQAAGQVGVANAISGGVNNAAGYYALSGMAKPPSPGYGDAGFTGY
jgi:hypothetical protein